MDREKIKIDLIIHDFKSPLAVVESGITLLLNNPEKYGPITAQQEKVLNRSLRNTRMIKMLANDALELGKSREKIVNLTNFRLSELFGETLIELFDLFDSNTSERIKTCTKLSEFKEAFVIPNKTGLAIEGFDPLLKSSSLTFLNLNLLTISPVRKSLSPGCSTL